MLLSSFRKKKAPRVGLEPTTSRLTAVRSTIELSRNISFASFRMSFIHSKLHTKSKNQTFLKAGHLDSASLHLDDFATQNSVCIKCHIRRQVCSMPLPTSCRLSPLWSSPRSISNSQLHVLPHFHLCPIYLVVFKGVYFIRMGYLILGGTSRLDAFSVYSFRTWLPGDAIGMTAGTPVVRPARSSRTKASSPQISYARAG